MNHKRLLLFQFVLWFSVVGVIGVVQAATADHLIISQVQITGGAGKSDNDFIELYNPSGRAIDIIGWKLRKRVQSGNESSIRVFGDGKTIPAFGFFLWANSKNGYAQSLGADESSTASIAANGSIALFDKEGALIDALAWGSGHSNPFIEGTPFNPEPEGLQSMERKTGGGQGNGQDTNNNSQDFFLTDSRPRSSQSPPGSETSSSSNSAAEAATGSSTTRQTPSSTPEATAAPVSVSTPISTPKATPTSTPPSSETSSSSNSAAEAATGSSTTRQTPSPTVSAEPVQTIISPQADFSGNSSLFFPGNNEQARPLIGGQASAAIGQSVSGGKSSWLLLGSLGVLIVVLYMRRYLRS